MVTNGAAFVLAVGVPIFNYVVGLGASLVRLLPLVCDHLTFIFLLENIR